MNEHDSQSPFDMKKMYEGPSPFGKPSEDSFEKTVQSSVPQSQFSESSRDYQPRNQSEVPASKPLTPKYGGNLTEAFITRVRQMAEEGKKQDTKDMKKAGGKIRLIIIAVIFFFYFFDFIIDAIRNL